MKKTAAITALVLAGAATTATAMDVNSSDAAAIHSYAPTADVSQLSEQEVRSILNVIGSGGSEGEIRQFVRALTADVR